MVKCKPERNVRQVTVIMLSCVTAFIAVSAAACIIDAYKWFFELLLIVVSVAGIYVVYRFSMSEMEYEICDGVFTVYKTVGKSAPPSARSTFRPRSRSSPKASICKS